MIYNIVTEPNPLLHQRSADVDPSVINTCETQKLIKDMIETMGVKNGVGLAAVQVGRLIRLCVITKKYSSINEREDVVLINPAWTKISVFKTEDEEGCLSVPGIYGMMKRYNKIRVKALDKNGQPIEFVADGFFARIVQHEVEHLDGHLFIEKAKNLRHLSEESNEL